MKVIVSYDVETTTKEGKSRLRRVAKACKGYGVRAQYSVFECSVGPVELVSLRAALLKIIDPAHDLRLASHAARPAHRGADVGSPRIENPYTGQNRAGLDAAARGPRRPSDQSKNPVDARRARRLKRLCGT
jgi:CRISPR-associated protein Cas2